MPISVTATPTVVLLLGRERSGKSALLNNLMGLDFNEKYINTTDVESIVIKNTDAGKIILRDTPGANRFNSITISWMHNTKDFICVIDPTTDDVSIQWVTLRNFLIQMVNVKWPSINLNVVITKTDLMGQKKTKLESSVTKLKQLIADFNSDGIKSFNCTITLFSSNAKYKPADHPIIKILHIQQKARIAAAPADGYLIENLCAKYEKATESRWGFTDASRAETLKNMRNELGVKLLTADLTNNDIIEILVKAARDIRTTENGRKKYGINFFCGMLHYGNYQDSQLYKAIKAQIADIDPDFNLEEASQPPLPPTRRNARVHSV